MPEDSKRLPPSAGPCPAARIPGSDPGTGGRGREKPAAAAPASLGCLEPRLDFSLDMTLSLSQS